MNKISGRSHSSTQICPRLPIMTSLRILNSAYSRLLITALVTILFGYIIVMWMVQHTEKQTILFT